MDFHYTVDTNKSVDEAIAALEQNLKQHQFGILWQLDLPAKLQEKGITTYTNPYRILEVCNPKVAATVLNEDELIGYFLPCKIVVYESGGKTKIGLTRPTALINFLDHSELNTIAADIESKLMNTIDISK